MKDFIFITGASGIGKTTLCNGLLEHYKTTCVEQHMVPEFISRDGTEPMTGELEELTCWENQVAMLMCFHKLGYKNIIASDIDDLRTADIPVVFKGTEFITIKLICSDLNQIQKQMKNRPNNGLIDFELQEKMNEKNISFFAPVRYFIVSKNKNSVNHVFNGKNTAAVAVTDAISVPFIITAGSDIQRDIGIRRWIMLKGMNRISPVIISP